MRAHAGAGSGADGQVGKALRKHNNCAVRPPGVREHVQGVEFGLGRVQLRDVRRSERLVVQPMPAGEHALDVDTNKCWQQAAMGRLVSYRMNDEHRTARS